MPKQNGTWADIHIINQNSPPPRPKAHIRLSLYTQDLECHCPWFPFHLVALILHGDKGVHRCSSPKPQPWNQVQISLINHNLLHLARSEQLAPIRTTWSRYPRLLTSHCSELHMIWARSGPFSYVHRISDVILLLTARTTCSDTESLIWEEHCCSRQVHGSHIPVLIYTLVCSYIQRHDIQHKYRILHDKQPVNVKSKWQDTATTNWKKNNQTETEALRKRRITM